MPKQIKQAASEPTIREYCSVQHPDFARVEDEAVPLRMWMLQGSAHSEKLEKIRRKLKAKKSAAVVEAIKEFGLRALRPGEEDKADLGGDANWVSDAEAFAELRDLMWRRIERWYRNARKGRSKEARTIATKRLQQIGSALAGSQRGKRKKIVANSYSLWATYWKTLFRVEMAKMLLSWPSDLNRQDKIRLVADAVGISARDISNWVQTRSGEVIRPLPKKSFARALTARQFDVSESTVSNILSRPAGTQG